MLNWFRFRNFISFITSSNRLAIYYRSSGCLRWIYVASLLNEKEGDTYDCGGKKGTEISKGICQIDFRY